MDETQIRAGYQGMTPEQLAGERETLVANNLYHALSNFADVVSPRGAQRGRGRPCNDDYFEIRQELIRGGQLRIKVIDSLLNSEPVQTS